MNLSRRFLKKYFPHLPVVVCAVLPGLPPEYLQLPGPHPLLAHPLLGQGGLDEQGRVPDVGVGPVVPVELELPVPAPGHGDLVLPLAEVQGVEVVLEDELARLVGPGFQQNMW